MEASPTMMTDGDTLYELISMNDEDVTATSRSIGALTLAVARIEHRKTRETRKQRDETESNAIALTCTCSHQMHGA